MELRHLATFRTLATTLNFTQTAALPGYVQSFVSAQIQELEADKPLFSLLVAKAAIVNQLHGLSICFASFHIVTPLREHFLMFPRFGNALIDCQNTAKKDTRKHLLLTDKQVSAVLRDHPLMSQTTKGFFAIAAPLRGY